MERATSEQGLVAKLMFDVYGLNRIMRARRSSLQTQSGGW